MPLSDTSGPRRNYCAILSNAVKFTHGQDSKSNIKSKKIPIQVVVARPPSSGSGEKPGMGVINTYHTTIGSI